MRDYYKQDPQCYMCRVMIKKDTEQEFKIDLKTYILCGACMGRLKIYSSRRSAMSEPTYGLSKQSCSYCFKNEHILTHQYVKVNETVKHLCSICWDEVRVRFVRSLNERRRS